MHLKLLQDYPPHPCGAVLEAGVDVDQATAAGLIGTQWAEATDAPVAAAPDTPAPEAPALDAGAAPAAA